MFRENKDSDFFLNNYRAEQKLTKKSNHFQSILDAINPIQKTKKQQKNVPQLINASTGGEP